jgi:dienelactone hydrolase
MTTTEYLPGRAADQYGDPAGRTVLMWHGAQTDARAAMRPLARHLALLGRHVVVPDWDSHAPDRGRADLLGSLRYCRDRGWERIVLVGWSLGGVAAAGLTVSQGVPADSAGIRILRTVCLAGAFGATDPVSGARLPTDLTGVEHRPPVALLHGVHDDVVPVAQSRAFAATLRRNGWPVTLAELEADHASIAGAVYDPGTDRYGPAEDAASLAVAASVAQHIVRGD